MCESAGGGEPRPARVANVNAAAAALRNWAMNLHKELDGTGVQAAHIGIDSSIGVSVIPGVEAARPEQITPLYWDLHTTRRDEAELVFRLDAKGFPASDPRRRIRSRPQTTRPAPRGFRRSARY
ncbi:hypothetical protein ABZT34_24925 [Streptomyces sp. NPDC005329]|uniref:hypothetical protein n=1 Tax=Streptomyces sp. NPDC005329 TaxID=3157034 RepID=UPI0033A8F82B